MRFTSQNDFYASLHLSFSEDKKKFHAYTNPMSSWDKSMLNVMDSVFNELNRFIEYDFRFISEYKKEMKADYEQVLNFNISNTLRKRPAAIHRIFRCICSSRAITVKRTAILAHTSSSGPGRQAWCSASGHRTRRPSA